MKPDHEISDIANEREVSELEVFRSAYLAWYGVTGDRTEIERDFGRYLRSGRVPVYVWHYVRQPRELKA